MVTLEAPVKSAPGVSAAGTEQRPAIRLKLNIRRADTLESPDRPTISLPQTRPGVSTWKAKWR